MSRLDFFTIFVVALCILAIIFLIFKATELAKGTGVSTPENTASVADIEDDDFSDEDNLYDSDSGNIGAEPDTNSDTDELGGSIDSDDDEMTGAGGNNDSNGNDYDLDEPEEADTETPAINREPEVISTDASLGKYLVIAGAFKIKSGAQTLARQLRNEGYTNAKSSIFDRGAFAVVLVDRFDSRSEAAALANRLKNSGTEAYVQAVRNAN